MSRKREHYRNGDPIVLHCGCDDCQPSMINGILCHETGCREEWRDQAIACFECGCDFYRTEGRWQRVCPECEWAIESGFEDKDDDWRWTP